MNHEKHKNRTTKTNIAKASKLELVNNAKMQIKDGNCFGYQGVHY